MHIAPGAKNGKKHLQLTSKKREKASPLPNGHIQVPFLVLQAKWSFFHEICDTIIVGGRQEADLSLPNIWPSPPWKTCNPRQLGQIQRETCDLKPCRKKPGPKPRSYQCGHVFFGWKILSTGPPVASNLNRPARTYTTCSLSLTLTSEMLKLFFPPNQTDLPSFVQMSFGFRKPSLDHPPKKHRGYQGAWALHRQGRCLRTSNS